MFPSASLVRRCSPRKRSLTLGFSSGYWMVTGFLKKCRREISIPLAMVGRYRRVNQASLLPGKSSRAVFSGAISMLISTSESETGRHVFQEQGGPDDVSQCDGD